MEEDDDYSGIPFQGQDLSSILDFFETGKENIQYNLNADGNTLVLLLEWDRDTRRRHFPTLDLESELVFSNDSFLFVSLKSGEMLSDRILTCPKQVQLFKLAKSIDRS